MPSGQVKATKQRKAIAQDERRHEAFRLWKAGRLGYREVGKQLGVSHETARKMVKDVLAEMHETYEGEISEWRTRQLYRLHEQLERYDRTGQEPDEVDENDPAYSHYKRWRDADVETGRLVLAILKEINEITGIKSPQKHEVTGKDGRPLNIVTNVILEFTDVNDSDK
jgi:hypothetical protein